MVFWTTFWIFAICLILESLTSWIFIRGSKKNHPELWVHAGEPTLIGNGDLVQAWPLTKYLIDRRYLGIKSEQAKLFAEKIRWPFVISYFASVLSVAVFFACLLIFGRPE